MWFTCQKIPQRWVISFIPHFFMRFEGFLDYYSIFIVYEYNLDRQAFCRPKHEFMLKKVRKPQKTHFKLGFLQCVFRGFFGLGFWVGFFVWTLLKIGPICPVSLIWDIILVLLFVNIFVCIGNNKINGFKTITYGNGGLYNRWETCAHFKQL